MKIVINGDYGGFILSKEAYKELGLIWDEYGYEFLEYEKRSNEKLVNVIEKIGDKANGEHASLKIVEIPDDVKWHIQEHEGRESVHEDHRSWD